MTGDIDVVERSIDLFTFGTIMLLLRPRSLVIRRGLESGYDAVTEVVNASNQSESGDDAVTEVVNAINVSGKKKSEKL